LSSHFTKVSRGSTQRLSRYWPMLWLSLLGCASELTHRSHSGESTAWVARTAMSRGKVLKELVVVDGIASVRVDDHCISVILVSLIKDQMR
jgi:hypothetical protein